MSKTVLVADDDATIRDVLELYLRREGFKVLSAADGRLALQTAHRDKPDLIAAILNLTYRNGQATRSRARLARHHRIAVGMAS